MKDGSPAKSFEILLVPASLTASLEMRTHTDDEGHYKFQGLKDGEYVLYPYDNSIRFPLRGDMFLSRNPDRITLSSQVNASFDLHLPEPAGILLGKVVRGKSAEEVEITICHEDETWRSATLKTDKDGNFRYIVPSGERLAITVRYPAYYSTLDGLVVAAGENRRVTINVSEPAYKSKGVRCQPFR